MTKFNGDLTILTIDGVQTIAQIDAKERGTCPHCEINLDNGVFEHDPSDNYKCEERRFCCMGCGGEFGPLLRKRKGVTHAGKTGKRNELSVKRYLKLATTEGNVVDYAAALTWVLATGRSEITLKIQMRTLGVTARK